MNYKMIARVNALILIIEAAFMLPALLISFFDGNLNTAAAFVKSIGIIAAAALLLYLFSRKARPGFYAREGLVCVGFCWITLSLAGCLPFYLSGEIPHYIDALFEIVSGFTTTGSSIATDVESLSRGILYWRSFSHWLGGMGVLVFLLAIIPLSGRNEGFTMHLLRAESPGPSVGKLVPRMKKTAMIMYIMYVLLTIVNIIFLLIGRMPLFDAICTAFGTAGTGGFGIKADSMASYSPYLQNVCTVFMLLFGVNFSCYFLLVLRRFKGVFQDEELRMYLGVFAGSTALIAWNIHSMYPTIGESIRHAAFQVSSIMTTTGFASTNFELWPSFSKGIILCLMIIGACAGSTGGGIKCIRVLLLLKILRRNVRQLLHPQKVQAIRVNNHVLNEKLLANTNAYLAAYIIILSVSFLIVSLDNFTVTTNFSAVLSCFNNIGPGLDTVGPMGSFAGFSDLSKLVLIFDMLAGRLEIFPILVLFSRSTWSHR